MCVYLKEGANVSNIFYILCLIYYREKTLAAKTVVLASDVPLTSGQYVGDKKRILNLSKF